MNLKDITVFENENFIVVDKPQGVVVNKSETQQKNTITHIVSKYLNLTPPKKFKSLNEEEFYEKSGVVHRLDKETGGLLVIAKNYKTYQSLKNLFIKRKIKKEYVAITFNDMSKFFNKKNSILINLPILRSKKNRHFFAINSAGRDATTMVEFLTKFNNATIVNPISYFDERFFSIVKVTPKTGRTHQIRVHLKALNCEIVGDTAYCGRSQKKFNEKYKFGLCLIAKKLEFKLFEKKYVFEADYNLNFKRAVEKLYSL